MKPRASSPRRDAAADAAALSFRIQPRASRNKIVRNEDGSYKMWLTAPPVDGAANEALVKFLGSLLGIAKSQIEIASGLTSKNKIVRISGISQADADRLLNPEHK